MSIALSSLSLSKSAHTRAPLTLRQHCSTAEHLVYRLMEIMSPFLPGDTHTVAVTMLLLSLSASHSLPTHNTNQQVHFCSLSRGSIRKKSRRRNKHDSFSLHVITQRTWTISYSVFIQGLCFLLLFHKCLTSHPIRFICLELLNVPLCYEKGKLISSSKT